MFSLEQKVYKKEKIPCENIQFVDNQGCIDLIEAFDKISIFKFLEEGCMMNQKDKAFADKI